MMRMVIGWRSVEAEQVRKAREEKREAKRRYVVRAQPRDEVTKRFVGLHRTREERNALKRAYSKTWYRENRDRALEYAAEWYREHVEQRRVYMREYMRRRAAERRKALESGVRA